MEKNKDAEKDIINAARNIFHKKGFKEATMRDIATEANTNLAMVNYYFRTKEKLFYIIFDETFMILINRVSKDILQKEVSIEEKIKVMTSEYVDFLSITHRYLYLFLVKLLGIHKR